MAITLKKTHTSSEPDEALRQNAIARRKLAPRLQWGEMSASEHFVQFYETDEFLAKPLSVWSPMN